MSFHQISIIVNFKFYYYSNIFVKDFIPNYYSKNWNFLTKEEADFEKYYFDVYNLEISQFCLVINYIREVVR